MQDCATSYPDETKVSIQSWQRLNTLVHTLISISGFQRRRIQQQYLQYKKQAAQWRQGLRESSLRRRSGKHASAAEQDGGARVGWGRLRSWALGRVNGAGSRALEAQGAEDGATLG